MEPELVVKQIKTALNFPEKLRKVTGLMLKAAKTETERRVLVSLRRRLG